MRPNFNEEKKLWKAGCAMVAGLDEAGRGPLAGPVVAVAVMVRPFDAIQSRQLFKNLKINDSKKLSAKQREHFYEILTNQENIQWGVGIVSEKIIDSINILQATKLAMQRALDQLNVEAGTILIDGNFGISTHLPQKSIIKGDEKVFSICAAGIIAKVTRDRIMEKAHVKYPQYGFSRHKGYGTALHLKKLEEFGPCKIHRKSFYPVSSPSQIKS